eukprot:795886_1
MVEQQLKNKIDGTRDIYVMTHGNRRLLPIVKQICIKLGFPKSHIYVARSTKVGNVGDYTASCWHPRSPDHIQIAIISSVEKKTARIVGLWAGVTTNIIETITLPHIMVRNQKIKLYVTSVGVASITAAFIYKFIRHKPSASHVQRPIISNSCV